MANPLFINTDKVPTYARALTLLKREGRSPPEVKRRQTEYRNNVIKYDHGKLKGIIGHTVEFKTMKKAYAIIKRIGVIRARH